MPRMMPMVASAEPRLELRRHRGVIEVAKLPAADEHLAAGKAHDVVELAAAEVDADRHRHRAEALQREEHERELDPVRQLDGDDVAGADAERAQPRRHAVDAVGKLAVAQPARSVGQRLAVGRLAHPAGQHVAKVSSPHRPAPRQRAAIAGVSRVSNAMKPPR